MLDFALSRLKEPSTWAGLGIVVSLFLGHDVAGDLWDKVVVAGTAIAGVLAVVLAEKSAA